MKQQLTKRQQARWARGFERHATINAQHRALQWRRRHGIPNIRLSFHTRIWIRIHERSSR